MTEWLKERNKKLFPLVLLDMTDTWTQDTNKFSINRSKAGERKKNVSLFQNKKFVDLNFQNSENK